MIKIDTASLRKDLLPKVKVLRAQALGRETMTAVAEQGVTIIHQRTAAGVDADGAGFQSYSEAYEKKRRKSGRGIRPDLTFSGRMLGAMTSKFVANGKATIVFTKGQEALKALGNSRLRPFFDIRRSIEIEALARELGRQIDSTIKRLGLGGSS